MHGVRAHSNLLSCWLWLPQDFRDVDDQLNGIYEIGIDWLQPFNSKQHSIGVVLLRSRDQPDALVSRASVNCHVVAIIVGPSEPDYINSCLHPLAEEFCRLGDPAGQGMTVSKRRVSEGGEFTQGEPFTHFVYLGAAHLDDPARRLVACSASIASYIKCLWCNFQSTRASSSDTGAGGNMFQYPMGYSTAAPQDLLHGGEGMFMNDPRLKLKAREIKHRALSSVGASVAQRQKLGFKGCSILARKLPYVSYKSLWLVPVAHALLYGVAKGFVRYLLRPFPADDKDGSHTATIISKAGRATIAGRAGHLMLSSEFGRQYRCLAKSHKSYRMEDWQHFLETYSLYIFKGDVLPGHCAKIWSNLQEVCRWYCRPKTADEFAPSARTRVAGLLFEVGLLLQSGGFPPNQMSANLHTLVCRLPMQEAERGQVCDACRQMQCIWASSHDVLCRVALVVKVAWLNRV